MQNEPRNSDISRAVVDYQLLNASDLPLDGIISSYVANTTEARLFRRRQAV